MPRTRTVPRREQAVGLFLLLLLGACAAEWPRAAIPVCEEPGTNCRCLLAGWKLCGDRCVYVAADRSNCGSCGTSCGDRFCVDGSCADTCGSYPQCGAVCRLPDDPTNCGQCGRVCGEDQTCTGGTCRTVPSCGYGEELCGDSCVDLSSNRANCGACGQACPAHLECESSTCQCSYSGDTNCGSYCADLAMDDDNCGSCGHACSTGSYCSSSYCH
jgi:hypothetical protein